MTSTPLPSLSVPCAIARDLIRFPTVNPPGQEQTALLWIRDLLASAGIEARLLGSDPQRPNLVARLPGRGLAPTLLLQGHIDVVPVEGQTWSVDPFAGVVRDGELWGRGAIDMKGQLAMMLAALLELRARGEAPAGDVVLAVLADEENGSTIGARHLVSRHRELFDDVVWSIGEDGGAELRLGTPRLHPVVVAEKRTCWLRLILSGPSGHASRPAHSDAAVWQLHRLLGALAALGPGEVRLLPVVDAMLATLATTRTGEQRRALEAFRARPDDDTTLAPLDPATRGYLRALVRHTITPTVLRGGTATNVVAETVHLELDCRLLPGPFDAGEFVDDLRTRLATDAAIEVLVEGEMAPAPTLGPRYEALANVLAVEDPGGIPLPVVTPASTDARVFRAIGIECFGWFPLLQPGTISRDLLHCADERIAETDLDFGARCFTRLLRTPM